MLREVETNGHQIEFDKEVLKKVFKIIRCLKVEILTINIHAKSISDTNFVRWIYDEVKNNKIRLSGIILEVTEHTAFTSDKCTVKNFILLKRLGFRIAMDEFGCDYSNLKRYVLMAPFLDFMKIHHKIYTTPHIFERLIHSIESLISRDAIIAECIESEAGAIYMNSKGIIMQQGFYYHRPKALG